MSEELFKAPDENPPLEDEDWPQVWKKLMWALAALAVPAWLIYLAIDSKEAMTLGGYLVRLFVLNLFLSVPVFLVLGLPLPEDAPQDLVRGVLLVVTCLSLPILAGSTGVFVVNEAHSLKYEPGGIKSLWWMCIFLVARSPVTFRHRFKAADTAPLLDTWIRGLSAVAMVASAFFPKMALPFLQIPVLREVVLWTIPK